MAVASVVRSVRLQWRCWFLLLDHYGKDDGCGAIHLFNDGYSSSNNNNAKDSTVSNDDDSNDQRAPIHPSRHSSQQQLWFVQFTHLLAHTHGMFEWWFERGFPLPLLQTMGYPYRATFFFEKSLFIQPLKHLVPHEVERKDFYEYICSLLVCWVLCCPALSRSPGDGRCFIICICVFCFFFVLLFLLLLLILAVDGWRWSCRCCGCYHCCWVLLEPFDGGGRNSGRTRSTIQWMTWLVGWLDTQTCCHVVCCVLSSPDCHSVFMSVCLSPWRLGAINSHSPSIGH